MNKLKALMASLLFSKLTNRLLKAEISSIFVSMASRVAPLCFHHKPINVADGNWPKGDDCLP